MPITQPAPVARSAAVNTFHPPRRPGPLLVATDGRSGVGALRAARHLAERSGAAVRVLTVVEPLPAYFGALDDSLVPPSLEEDRRAAQLELVRRQVHDVIGAGAAWPVEAREGDPALVITDAAREAAASLILVGAGRHHLLDRLLAEETALAVARHADRPVLVVPEGVDLTPRTVVAAIDFGPAGSHAAAAALVRGAECAVLVAAEPPAAEAERLERALTGASAGSDPDTWCAQLDGYTRRHAGRRAVLAVDDRALGAATEAAGYLFLGAAYDPHDRRVALMLGAPEGGGPHLTRTIGDVETIVVEGAQTDDDRGDETLVVRHGRGRTLLTLLPDRPSAA